MAVESAVTNGRPLSLLNPVTSAAGSRSGPKQKKTVAMDDLVDSLASAFHVSGDSFSSNAAAGHPHFSNYKNRGMAAEKQAQRRQEFLESQKTKRLAAVALVRHLDVDGGEGETIEVDAENESAEGTAASADSGETSRRRKPREISPFQNQLMCSEWLIHVPENMAEEWIVVPCPEGKRVLVVAVKGLTKVYAKNGRLLKEFSSALPGGFKNSENYKSKATILDCVFCQDQSTFYCLDVICWNGCSVFNSDTEFRFFWLQSKLAEEPSLLQTSNSNRHAFTALPRCACSKQEVERIMVEKFPFKLDGLLFYHKGAQYTAGQTPLVGWLKPFMLPEILGVSVPAEYVVGYESTASKSFMADFNSQYQSKHGGRQYGGKKETSESESSATHMDA